MKIVTVQQMREIEQASVEHGVSLDQLQRSAASAIARQVARLVGDPFGTLLVLAGRGNNGRDALIAGALLAEQGRKVRAYLAPQAASEDVVDRLARAGGEVAREDNASGRATLERWVAESSAVVDGLLGIGVRGAAREPIAGIISAVDEECLSRGIPVIAVDLPSGIDADTGEVGGPALHATWTLSLGCVKAGLLRLPAAEYVGRLIPLDIGLPPETYRSVPIELLTPDEVRKLLPRRPLNGHKGTFGRVLAVTGSRNFVGASYLVGAAAARSGCGIITLAIPEWQRSPISSLLPEATYLPLQDSDDLQTARANASAVADLLPDCSAFAIGPGLGQGASQTELVVGALTAARKTGGVRTVIDADALNALSGVDAWWEKIGANHVLTPHPGEMARLTGLSVKQVNEGRWDVARDFADRWGEIVVLKGAFTVVATPGGRCWVSGAAIPALGTGGTGDVLTGLIAGLLAQGLSGEDAARAGVYLHAHAAETVLATTGTDRLLASDLIPAIPAVIAQVQHSS